MAAVPIEQAVQHCLRVWLHAAVAALLQPANQQTESSDHQLADQVDVRIVDAAWQDLAESPTEESARLLPLLNADNTSTDIALPTPLDMLRKSPHYTLAMGSVVPCIPESLQASFVDVPSATTSFRPCTQMSCVGLAPNCGINARYFLRPRRC